MTTPINAGSVEVEVRADAKGFDAELGREVRESMARAQIAADRGGAQFGKRFARNAAIGAAAGAAAQPLGAALLATTGALAAPLAAAAAGVGAFAAVAIPAYAKIVKGSEDLVKAQTKVDNALTKKERATAIARQKQLIDSLDPTQKRAIASLDRLKTAFAQVQKSLEPEIFGVFDAGLRAITASLPAVERLARAAAPAIKEVLEGITRSLEGPGANRAITFLEERAPKAIKAFAKGVGDIGQGFAGISRELDVFSGDVGGGLGDLLDKFSRVGDSQGLQTFIGYVQTNGPLVKDVLSRLGEAIVAITDASRPLGPVILGSLGLLAETITRIPQPVLTALIATLIVGKTTLGVFAGVTRAAGAAQRFFFTTTNKSTGAVRASTVAQIRAGVVTAALAVKTRVLAIATRAYAVAQRILNVALRANPIGILITALAVLATGLVIAYRRSETFRNVVNGALRAVGKVAVTVIDGILAVFGGLFKVLGRLPGKLGAPFRAASAEIQGTRDTLRGVEIALDNLGRKKARPSIELLGVARLEEDAIRAEKALQRVFTPGGGSNNAKRPAPKVKSGPTGRRGQVVAAEGGIVRRPTFLLAGEAGPEAIVPLGKTPGNSALPAGLGTKVVQNFYVTERPDSDALMRQAAFRFRVAAGG